jgi:hypothetical protein
MDYIKHHVDREAGMNAIDFIAPLLERAARDPQIGQSGVVYAVVMNPARAPGSFSFEDAVLAERAFGKPREQWDADYAQYARKKVRASWQCGVDSGSERTAAYWKAEGHDRPLAGGVVLHGIAVGVSGAEPAYDEVLAGAIALSLRAAIRIRGAVTTS